MARAINRNSPTNHVITSTDNPGTKVTHSELNPVWEFFNYKCVFLRN